MEGKKQIAILHPSMMFGGAEKVLVNMLHYFDYEHYDVDLYLFRYADDLLNRIDKRVNIIYKEGYLSGKDLLSTYAKNGKCFSLVQLFIKLCLSKIFPNKDFGKTIDYRYRDVPILSDKQYDTIIVYQCLGSTLMYYASNKMFSKKKVAWLHGDGGGGTPLSLFQKMDKIYCVSESIRNDLITNYPVLKDRTEIFYNLVDAEEIVQKAAEPIQETLGDTSIVTVARLSPEKGIIMIPEIARLLCESGCDFEWYVVGDGPEREIIEKEIACQKVSDSVFLLGSKDNPYPYIKNCTIYVQPSYTEGYCTTTNEARVLCKPVVTTNVSGMHEQFKNGENGWIVGGFTPNDLFEGIKYMLDHPELQKKFSESLSKEQSNNIQELNKLYSFINS